MTPNQLDRLQLAITNMVLMDDGEEPITMAQLQQDATDNPAEFAKVRERVQRMAVAVLDIVGDDIDPSEISIEAWPPSSPAGFKVGMPKGVHIRHLTLGASVICDTERSQHLNRDKAMRAMRMLLHAH